MNVSEVAAARHAALWRARKTLRLALARRDDAATVRRRRGSQRVAIPTDDAPIGEGPMLEIFAMDDWYVRVLPEPSEVPHPTPEAVRFCTSGARDYNITTAIALLHAVATGDLERVRARCDALLVGLRLTDPRNPADDGDCNCVAARLLPKTLAGAHRLLDELGVPKGTTGSPRCGARMMERIRWLGKTTLAEKFLVAQRQAEARIAEKADARRVDRDVLLGIRIYGDGSSQSEGVNATVLESVVAFAIAHLARTWATHNTADPDAAAIAVIEHALELIRNPSQQRTP